MDDPFEHDQPQPIQPQLGAALNTDLYELTMAAGYFEAGKADNRATFELFVRRLPWNRNFVLAAGLAQAVEYLLNLQFTAAEIAYLKTLPQFEHTRCGFFEMLAGLRFSGDVFAVSCDRDFLPPLDEVEQLAELVFASKAPTTFMGL